ncbi:unnamed protein product (macronuclear) [Paramecium tetraurelia]|uniref:Transmembrane protein n=1 Tax=Paramecium tetraurelia TaxID=5888 RepID=A0CFI9_PARTE|nr:uncharacterized protein GSPATT00037995001 [Paramecium tetraurelia]CAK69556.1 unnamed protein product [Paramecium tetraurelia]|eukprot:XP_001436953.1 hypothetical protein (macronuclear) [Paramecium tetraurelia strain d4-2]
MVTELCSGCEHLTETKNSQSIIKNVNGLNTYYQCKQYLYPKDNTYTEICIECNQGFYLKNNHCQQCPQGCLSCTLDKQLEQVRCLDCQQGHSLFNESCQKCGELCQICKKILNKYTGKEYMKCLKCNHNAYISLDGESCYLNNIDLCIYPFQFSIRSTSINTLIYDFQPQELKNILTGCIYCLAASILETENINILVLLQQLSKDQVDAIKQFIYKISFIALLVSIMQCRLDLDSAINLFLTVLFVTERIGKFIVAAFYVKMLLQACNSECKTCIQVDSSRMQKHSLMPIYTILSDFYIENYSYLTQNLNNNEIEMICTECQDGYIKYYDKCIQKCPSNCKECKIIDDQQVCLSCIQFNDSHYHVYNGRCIQCPQNCNICHPRTDNEKLIINPFFNNKDLEHFSHKCIAPLSSDLFYDQDIHQFIKCDNIQELQKEIVIQIQIYCSQIDLENYLNQLNEEQKVIQRKFHILLENLDLSLYEYYDYFLYLNQNFVKIVTYQLTIADNQLCSFNKELKIQSNLQTNTFSLIELNLILKGSGNTLNLNNRLSLQILHTQELKTLIFKCRLDMYQWIMSIVILQIFNPLKSIKIKLIYSIKSIQSKLVNRPKLIFRNYRYITLMFNLNMAYLNSKLIALDLIINHVKILNTSIINYNTSQKVETKILNLYIQNSQFINTALIEQFLQTEILRIDNFIFENSILLNTTSFLNFEQIQKAELNGFPILDSTLQNSNFISSSKILFLIEFKIQNSHFQDNPHYQSIKAKDLLNQYKLKMNVYSNKHALILLLNSDSVYLNNIEFINNAINIDDQKDSLDKNIELSIINIESNTVIFDTLMIQRGIGYSEFTIKNANTFKFLNSVIILHEKYYFKSLFNNQECNIQLFNQFMYNTLMNLQNSQFTYVSNTNITDIILYDSVLFEIQMLSQISSQFVFINCNFSSNILHQVNKYEKVSLTSINPNYYLNLNLTKVSFSQNLLNLLKESNPKKQSLILIVEASQAKSKINNCIIQKNMILNGQGYVSNNELTTLTQEYSLIHCYDCQFQIRHLHVTNYPPIPLFQLYGSANLKNISIQNFIFSNQLMLFSPVRQSDQINLDNIEFYNCTRIHITENSIPSKRNAKILNISVKTSCNNNLIDAPSTFLNLMRVSLILIKQHFQKLYSLRYNHQQQL